MELSELMTPEETRSYLHIGNNKMYELLHTRTFPSVKIGRSYYVIKDELAKWLLTQSKK